MFKLSSCSDVLLSLDGLQSTLVLPNYRFLRVYVYMYQKQIKEKKKSETASHRKQWILQFHKGIWEHTSNIGVLLRSSHLFTELMHRAFKYLLSFYHHTCPSFVVADQFTLCSPGQAQNRILGQDFQDQLYVHICHLLQTIAPSLDFPRQTSFITSTFCMIWSTGLIEPISSVPLQGVIKPPDCLTVPDYFLLFSSGSCCTKSLNSY